MTKRADSGPTGFQTPTESTQQSTSGWQANPNAVDSGPSGYGDTAVNARDETGYGSLGAEAPAEQGKLSSQS